MAQKKKKVKKAPPKPMSDKQFLREKARSFPLFRCYISEEWKNIGIASILVTRERGNGKLCVANFLCDIWCLGIKDAAGNISMSKEDFFEYVNKNHMVECDYDLVHNLIYGSIAFAKKIGIQPMADFAFWGYLLEKDTDDIPNLNLEFGRNGKYFLVTDAGTKWAQLITPLKKRLGDQFDYLIRFDPFTYEDDLNNEEEDEEDFKMSEEDLKRIIAGFENSFAEDKRHKSEPYSYNRPDYPKTLEIKHQFIADEFRKPDNRNGLPDEIIDRIIELPKHEVSRDISNILLHKIGETWQAIDNNELEWEDDNTVLHCIAFMAELGDPSVLNSAMEYLRQDNDFHEFHMGDCTDLIVPQMLFILAKDRTEIFEEFLRQPGLDVYAKDSVSRALLAIAQEEPERRNEIIEIYRRYLDFMYENIPICNGCTGLLAGFIISNLISLNAVELLPEIKRLYDSGYVNLNICGSYNDVEEHIKDTNRQYKIFDFKGIKDFYAHLRKSFGE